MTTRICINCDTEIAGKVLRERCRPCYRRHVKELKKAGEFVARVNPASRAAIDRLLARVTKSANGCWHHGGHYTKHGYSRLTDEVGRTALAHRVSYEAFVGPIPDGMHVDHECHNRDTSCPGGRTCLHRRCVNPDHLAAKTPQEHAQSGRNGSRTHCRRGHEFTPENTKLRSGGGRQCRTCLRVAWAAQRTRRGVTPAMTHGKRSTYTKGCRCDLCVATERKRGKERRARALR